MSARRQRLGAAPRLRAGAVLLLTLAVDVPACNPSSEAERFIQGTWWQLGTMAGEPQHRAISFYLEWTFRSGAFRQSGYPPLLSEGSYRVVRAEPAAITLLLYQQKGDFSDADRTIAIAIDRDDGTISIDQGPPLRRKSR